MNHNISVLNGFRATDRVEKDFFPFPSVLSSLRPHPDARAATPPASRFRLTSTLLRRFFVRAVWAITLVRLRASEELDAARKEHAKTFKGASRALVPVRPRWRGERRSLRTLSPGASLRPHLAGFNPDAHTSTPFNSASDAFQLHPDIIARMERPLAR